MTSQKRCGSWKENQSKGTRAQQQLIRRTREKGKDRRAKQKRDKVKKSVQERGDLREAK